MRSRSVDSHPGPFSQGYALQSAAALPGGSRGLVRRAGALVTLAALGAALAGCGGSSSTASTQAPGPAQTPSSFAAAAANVAEVANFGASITCGYYATPDGGSGYVYSHRGYAGVFDAKLGVPAQNLCRPGDQAADMVRSWVLPQAAPALGAHQLYTVLVGTNDVINCGLKTGCLSNWLNALNAAVTWMALPASDKILGSSLSNLSSQWARDPEPEPGFGVATSAAGASLSFPVTQTVAGRNLYLAYRVFDAGTVTGGTATVQVDGTPVATLSSIVASGHAIATKHGLHDTVYVAAIPLGAAGMHKITITNGSAGGFFSFQWAGVASGSYATDPGAPRVMVATLPPTRNAEHNADENVYNEALLDAVPSLLADGMHVTVVHCEAVLDTSTEMYDDVHPNDSGHQKVSSAFVNAL